MDAIVDPLDAIVERSEANNAMARNFTIVDPSKLLGHNATANATGNATKHHKKFLGVPAPEMAPVAGVLVVAAAVARRRKR